MNNREVARVLEDIGTLLEILGENPFKCRAYHNAARIIEGVTEDLTGLVERSELESIKGIGKGLAEKISELVRTGKMSYHEELRGKLPPGVPDLMRIPGLGPKKIKILYETLGIASLEDLRSAVQAQRLRELDGFGARTEENILRGLEQVTARADKHLLSTAEEAALPILQYLATQPGVQRGEIAGSVRRRKEVIGDIDIVLSCSARTRQRVMKAFVEHPGVQTITAQGDTKTSVLLRQGIACDVRIVSDREYPFALNYFTGSKEHNVEMRSRARERGWSLNEYGFTAVKPAAGGSRTRRTPPDCRDEEGIYRALGLSYIPPELREHSGEFEAAAAGRLPRLVEEDDLQGTFHCHTNYSDGVNTLEEMAGAARKRGWKYLGIADHSKSAGYAGGLSPERVRKQLREIESLNERSRGFRIFSGTEADILADGSLDFSDRVLSGFDYVVASIHSRFKMTEAEATARIIKALKNPYVTILGHPTGRLLLQREGYPVSLPDVIQAAADYGKAIEINAHPLRLDLDWRFVRLAKEKRVRICINPDAHTIQGLSDVRFGVGVARKGWLTAKDVLNTEPPKAVEAFFTSLRPRAR